MEMDQEQLEMERVQERQVCVHWHLERQQGQQQGGLPLCVPASVLACLHACLCAWSY